MLDRHDLTDEEWARLEPLLPSQEPQLPGVEREAARDLVRARDAVRGDLGLDPITTRALQLGRGSDLTVDPLRAQEPGQPEPGRPRLLSDRDRPR